MTLPSFDPGGIIKNRFKMRFNTYLQLIFIVTLLTPTIISKRHKRGLEHLDTDTDHVPDHHFVSLAGIEPNSTHDEYSRAFLHVRHMLTSLACYHWERSSVKNCPYNQLRYFKALRNYGCNCYPDNHDTVNLFTGGTLWVLGINGAGIDDVDKACQNAYHRYNCYEMDGCFKGTAYRYFVDEAGDIQCGTETDVDYASNPEKFKCELASCRVERTLTETLYPLIGYPDTFRKINKGNYNAWKNEQVCFETKHEGRTTGGPKRKTECCGEYPRRKTYNPNKYECCTDGKVRPQGFC